VVQLLLSPISQPGACLPLAGTSGWVDIRLARPITPTAFTYEHIPASIAHDIRTAPHNLTLFGFVGKPPAPAAGMVPASPSAAAAGEGSATNGGVRLGSFAFDAQARRPWQTFQLTPTGQGSGQGSGQAGQGESSASAGALPAVDHVRLVISSNHGHRDYTCLYRLRVHGTPQVAPA